MKIPKIIFSLGETNKEVSWNSPYVYAHRIKLFWQQIFPADFVLHQI